MGRVLPPCPTSAEFARIAKDEQTLGPGVRELCRILGVGPELSRYTAGSLPVYAVGERHVLKLYPPYDLVECEREAAVLDVLAGALPIPTPRRLATGTHCEWGYLLMDRLEGELLDQAWPTIRMAQRRRLASALGEALGVLHRLDVHLPSAHVDWRTFIGEQRRTAEERQVARGLDRDWVRQIADF